MQAFSGLFWACALPGNTQWLSNFPWSIVASISASQRVKQREKKEKWHWLYKSHWVTLDRGGGACKNGGIYNNLSYHFFICKSLIRICSQKSYLTFRGLGSFCPPWLLQTVCKWLQGKKKKMAACHRLEEWGMDSYYCVKNWSWLKLTIIYHQRLFL